jgi:hypothetical protein
MPEKNPAAEIIQMFASQQEHEEAVADGLRLIKAFLSIPDRAARARVLQFAEQIAKGEARP